MSLPAGSYAGLPAGFIVGVDGCGVTGARIAAHLVAAGVRVAVHDPDAQACARLRGPNVVRVDAARDLGSCDLVVLAGPAGHHSRLVRDLLEDGVTTVSIGDDLADTRELLALQDVAAHRGTTVVVGAGMAPGLSGLLARSLVAHLHQVDELHVAIHGTAGPACARQHHSALGHAGLGWHDGEWIEPRGGSGRDLVWFPEPIAAHDCYRAAVADPLLLQRGFPTAQRISARVSATRRDRMTARLPMLTPPHASGDLGAVRVEARGAASTGERVTVISGASGHTADLAAAVCAATVLQLARQGAPAGVHALGDEALEPLDLLHHATRLGVRVQEFTGVARPTHW